MDEKKKPGKADYASLTVNSLLYIVWGSSPVVMLAMLFVFFLIGEPVWGVVMIAALVVWVIFTRFHFNRYSRQLEKEEQQSRAENVTEYTVGCGKLGTLSFAYDRRIGHSVLQGRLPDIFCAGESAVLSAAEMRADGRVVEMVVDRLFAERSIIFQGAVQEFNSIADKMVNPFGLLQRVYPSGLRLREIAIDGGQVTCELALTGISENICAMVSFTNGFAGYNIELRSDDDV